MNFIDNFITKFHSTFIEKDRWMYLLDGLKTTLLITFFAVILGMVLGNMDMDIRKVFAGGNAIILPFLGFEFGSTINLIDAAKMLPQGLLMSIIYFIIVITPSYIFERTVLHRPGYASVASGSLAGVALVSPAWRQPPTRPSSRM